jgi:polysaccharide chain length determinant protein (PEP-CTERM system associated)
VIPGKNYAPEELLRIAWARKKLVAACLVAGAAIAFGYGKSLPQRYLSWTTIVLAPERIADGYIDARRAPRMEDWLRATPQRLKSRERLEQLITEFDLYRDGQDGCQTMDQKIDCMRRDAAIDISDNYTFRISYLAPDPKLAMRVTDRLASRAIAEMVTESQKVTTRTFEFLDDALNSARANLEAQERRLEDYRRRYAGELPDQLQGNQQVLQSTQGQAQAIQDSLSRDRDRRLSINRELGDLQSAVASDATPGEITAADLPDSPLTRQLKQAEDTLSALRARYTSEHPDVVLAQKAVADLRAEVTRGARARASSGGGADTPVASPRTVARQNRIRELQAELDATDRQIAAKLAEERRLRAAAGEVLRRIDATPTRDTELIKLTRDYQTFSQIYTNLLAKKQDSIITDKANPRGADQFKVIDPPRVPRLPASPDLVRITATGSVIGLICAFALIALFEYRNLALRDEDELAACTGLPVVAVIPLMSPKPVGGSTPRVRHLLGKFSGGAELPAAQGQ